MTDDCSLTQWTIAEAKKMARWNRRASYLAETGVYVQHYSRSNSNNSRTRTKSRRKSTQRNRKRRRNF